MILRVEDGADGGRVVHADGFLLKLSKATKLDLDPAIKTLGDVAANQFIGYGGKHEKDGTVTVEAAWVVPNVVEDREARLRKSKEFDPAAIDEGNKQSDTSKFLRGTDWKRLPAHHDEDLQARVTKIGNKLVPAYQRALADGDATKIDFRFQVVDTPYRGAVGLASGIIVVGYPAITRLQTDSEIAAVLADQIALVLEKEELLNGGARKRAGALALGTAGMGFIPGVGLGTALIGQMTAASAGYKLMGGEKVVSERVALALMWDAGYDVREAPLAWWELAPVKPLPLDKVEIPETATYLYMLLGTTWRERLKDHAVAAPGS